MVEWFWVKIVDYHRSLQPVFIRHHPSLIFRLHDDRVGSAHSILGDVSFEPAQWECPSRPVAYSWTRNVIVVRDVENESSVVPLAIESTHPCICRQCALIDYRRAQFY
jgi:hypothetical protein